MKIRMWSLVASVLLPMALNVGAAETAESGSITGSVDAGKAKAGACAACHGGDGNSATPDFPSLAGQSKRYIVEQLQAMKDGTRPAPLMASLLPGLSEQDFHDLGAFYESLKPNYKAADPELAATAEVLYRQGDKERGIAACAACHGAQGKGMPSAGFPSLAGQHAKYTELQLRAFRAVGRGDDEGPYRKTGGDAQMMQGVAKYLSDSEIKALANYIQGMYTPEAE